MDATPLVTLVPAVPYTDALQTNCTMTLTNNTCIAPNHPEYMMMVMAFMIARLPLKFMTAQSGYNSSDFVNDMLDDVRLGDANLTDPQFTPLPSRLSNLSVITTPLIFKEIGFMINRDLTSGFRYIGWNEIFAPLIWGFIGAWRLFTVVYPSFPLRCRAFASFLSILMFFSIFGLLVKVMYTKMFLFHKFEVHVRPFSNQEEAALFVISRKSAKLVYAGYLLPGSLRTDLFPSRQLLQLDNLFQVVNYVTKKPLSFAVSNFDVLQALLRLKSLAHYRNKLAVFSEVTSHYLLSFCHKTYPYKEKITLAYEYLNEMGGIYLADRKLTDQWQQVHNLAALDIELFVPSFNICLLFVLACACALCTECAVSLMMRMSRKSFSMWQRGVILK